MGTIKPIKILALETHFKKEGDKYSTSGVDFARIVLPLKELSKDPEFEISIRQNPFEGYKEQSWQELASNFDIFYTSYIDSPEGYVNMALMAKKHNVCVAIDLDDNLWRVDSRSPVGAVYYHGSDALHVASCVLEDVAHITTTNQFLKYRIAEYTASNPSKITALPNYIDLEMYDKSKIPETKRNKIVIGFFGTSTHLIDLVFEPYLNAITRICKEFPNVEFQTTGLFLPQVKTKLGKQYKFVLGKSDVYSWASTLWPKMMSEVDIFTAPLVPTEFNKCKSNIKALEIGAGSKPGVYQDIRQYQETIENGVNGFLAETEEDWYKSLKKLVESETLRKEMGQRAYEKIFEKYQMKNNVWKYKEYFKSLIEGRKPEIWLPNTTYSV